jgi:hypothetical protein
MPNRKIHLALLTGLVLAPAIAFAADAPGGRPDMPRGPGMHHGMMTPEIVNLAFSALDTNKDGKISKEEFEAKRPARIQMADANKDGKVSKKEYEKFVVERAKQRADQMFARLDRNKDGKIDSEDTKMMADARFDRVDANHDGVITKDEFAPRGAMARRDRDRHFRGPRPDRGVTTK